MTWHEAHDNIILVGKKIPTSKLISNKKKAENVSTWFLKNIKESNKTFRNCSGYMKVKYINWNY